MIVILSDERDSSMSEFLTEVSEKLDKDKPSKVAILWETPDGVMMGLHKLNVNDIQNFGMVMVTESIIRTVAYSQDYIEKLQNEE